MRFWLIALLICTLKRLSSIEIQCDKGFHHLKPKAAINYTEISSLIFWIFNEHNFQYNGEKYDWRLNSCLIPSFLWSVVLQHRMDKRKSFVLDRQYRNCFSRRINALVPRNQPIKTAIGMVTHDIHGLKTMTFHRVTYIAYFWLAVTEIIQFFSRNVPPETCSKP